jgi:glycosyltransferase involved in cell wall biosynthesis
MESWNTTHKEFPSTVAKNQGNPHGVNGSVMNKTICILPQKLGLGGPASFQSRLISVLIERGYSINHDADDPANSAILVIGGTKNINSLRRARRKGIRIVQRLNGMNWVHRKKNTGLKHYIRAEIGNRILSSIRGMADQIIYQSEFTQNWWNKSYRETKSPAVVIYNGVDLTQFSPHGTEQPPADFYRLLLVEGHLGGGYEQGLFSAVKLTKLLNQRLDKKVELMVVGNVPDTLKKSIDEMDVNVFWKGIVKREEIPMIDRSAHLLFSSDINAACPNSVIEAMACGLPVIGYDTGALPELVSDNAGAIAAYGGDPWNLDEPNIHSLADAAQRVLKNQVEYKQGARARAIEKFNILQITDQYIRVLDCE